MSYEIALSALGDPTRQAIVGLLRQGPKSVGKLGQILPVSRPAVSQHLKVLSNAGLVTSEPKGNRRIYSLSPEGIADLRDALDGLWDDALKGLEDRANDIAKGHAMIEPIEKTLQLPIPADRAFAVFTTEIATWWPLATHSLSASSGALPIGLEIDARVGGQIVEILFDGRKSPWGRITAWQPPRHFAMTWHVGRPESEASQISVTFSNNSEGCLVKLIHDNWDALGDAGENLRDNYHSGWDMVLGGFRARATA